MHMHHIKAIAVIASSAIATLSVCTTAFAAINCSCMEDAEPLQSHYSWMSDDDVQCTISNMWKDKQTLSTYFQTPAYVGQPPVPGYTRQADCDALESECMTQAYNIPEGADARAACKAHVAAGDEEL